MFFSYGCKTIKIFNTLSEMLDALHVCDILYEMDIKTGHLEEFTNIDFILSKFMNLLI